MYCVLGFKPVVAVAPAGNVPHAAHQAQAWSSAYPTGPYVTGYGPTYHNGQSVHPPEYLAAPQLATPQFPPGINYTNGAVLPQGYTANHAQFGIQMAQQRKRATAPTPPHFSRQTAALAPAPTYEECSVKVSLAYLKDKTHKLENIGVGSSYY